MERARACVCAHNFVSAEQFAHLSGPCSGRPETGMYRHMMLFTRKHHQSGHAEVGERASVAIKPCQLIRQACASSATGQAVQSICAILHLSWFNMLYNEQASHAGLYARDACHGGPEPLRKSRRRYAACFSTSNGGSAMRSAAAILCAGSRKIANLVPEGSLCD